MKRSKTLVKLLATCLSMLGLIACQGGSSPKAKDLLEKARHALEEGDYNAVRLCADSIDSAFITDSTARWEALGLVRQAELAQSKQNLAYIDSLLPILESECSNTERAFERHQSDPDRIATYSLQPFNLGRVAQQSMLRMACDTTGKLYLESVYVGASPIRHVGIRLSDMETKARLSSSAIAHDQGINYRYEIDGRHYEVISYPEGDALLLSEMIKQVAREGQSMLVEYLNEAQHAKDDNNSQARIRIGGEDLKKLNRIIELQALFQQRKKLREEKQYNLRRRSYLENKLVLNK